MIASIELKNPEFAQAMFGAPLDSLELIEVMSDCMEPALFYGDQVFVDTRHKKFSCDGIYAFKVGDITLIRLVQFMFRKPKSACIRVACLDKRYGEELYSREQFEKFEMIGMLTHYKFGKFQTYTNQNHALNEALTHG